MSDKAIEQTRKEFEAKWEALHGNRLLARKLTMGGDLSGEYKDSRIGLAWSTWQAAKEQYASKWISVEDRLPNNNCEEYLIWPRHGFGYSEGMTATLINGHWFAIWEDNYTANNKAEIEVTHWMPIPQLGD